ncbi:hypothetical protein [Pedobacter sp.]
MKIFGLKLVVGALFFISYAYNLNAQELYMSDVSGTALRKDSKYAEVEGTPFLFKDWMNGSVIFASNRVVKSIPLKFNLESGEIYFKSPQSGNEMLFSDAVRSFTVNGRTFQAGFEPVDGNSKVTFYEVLGSADNKVKLLKKVNKTIMEVTEYNAPNKKVFKENFGYYLVNDSKMPMKVKKDNSILSQFNEKEAQVKEFISKNKLNVKKDEDLAKILDYYNTL